MEVKPSERELWEVTRMSRPALDSVIEQSLMLEPWKVVVAYCEYQRRGGTIPPRTANSFMVLVKDKRYEGVAEFIDDTLKGLGYENYSDLLVTVNKLDQMPSRPEHGERPDQAATFNDLKPHGHRSAVLNSSNSMEEWYNQKWLVVLLCVVFFPVGLYALWKSEAITRGWKFGVLSLMALLGAFAVNQMRDDALSVGAEAQASTSSKVSFEEARLFMRDRSNDVGQTLVDELESDAYGSPVYLFLTSDQTGLRYCVSMISSIKLEVVSTDCGYVEEKVADWKRLVDSHHGLR